METDERLMDRRSVDEGKWRGVGGWLWVSGLALLFLLYGLFMYIAIGDRGMPGWDFGTVKDIPGESVYSTHPQAGVPLTAPEPQHVRNKPALAPMNREGE